MQALVGGLRVHEVLPRADDALERRQRLGREHHVGEQHARPDHLLEHEEAAAGEHQHLDEHAHELDDVADAAGGLAGMGLALDQHAAVDRPALVERRHHAERAGDLGVAHRHVEELVAAVGRVVHRRQRLARHPVLQEGEPEQHEAADQADHADPRIDHEQGEHEDRRPGEIEHHRHAGAGEDLPKLVQVSDRLRLAGAVGRLALEHRPKQVVREHAVEDHAELDQDLGAVVVDDRLQQEAAEHGQREDDQRRNALTAEHTAVELDHVDR